MTRVRWAIAGPGVIGADFAAALTRSSSGVLHAVASTDPARAAAFAAARGVQISGSYAEILARDDVDAVYVATVHTTHAQIAIAALEAGKAVLCEKPLATSVADTTAMIAAAQLAGMPFIEAFKYRFGPFPEALRRLVAEGAIGEITAVEASSGFAAAERTGRLFDPTTAGGAILDVGCYPLSFAVAVASWAGKLNDATLVDADGVIGDTGVDETTRATVDIGGIRAGISTSIVAPLPRSSVIRGTAGAIELPNVWGSRTEGATTAVVRDLRGDARVVEVPAVDPMAAEADATALALREGRAEASEMPWAESLEIARLLASWRAAISQRGVWRGRAEYLQE